MKHLVCFSGGHSSALTAIEVKRAHGAENVVLVNHDMHFSVEDPSIKRFKAEVAGYLGLPITFVNYADAQLDQFDVCVQAKAFKVGDGKELCTNRLKTGPFMKYLSANHPPGSCVIYYGFDETKRELTRVQRRSGALAADGYHSDYPLALWPLNKRTIFATEEVGITRPATYGTFIHGNCIGCLKAGWQHWYIVYCTRPDIWLKGKWAEDEIGYAIHHDESGPVYLEDMEQKFEAMKAAGIPATERIPQQRFWAQANKIVEIRQTQADLLPCECAA